MRLASDDFNRSDSGTLGSNWTKLSVYADLTISNNRCASPTPMAGADAYTGKSEFPLDQYSQALVITVNKGGLTVRSNLASTFYLFFEGTSNLANVYKVIGGASTLLSSVAHTWGGTEVAFIQVKGTAILTKVNGVVLNDFTDSAIDGVTVGGPYTGVYGETPANEIWDDWEGGDLGLTRQDFRGSRPRPFAPGLAR